MDNSLCAMRQYVSSTEEHAQLGEIALNMWANLRQSVNRWALFPERSQSGGKVLSIEMHRKAFKFGRDPVVPVRAAHSLSREKLDMADCLGAAQTDLGGDLHGPVHQLSRRNDLVDQSPVPECAGIEQPRGVEQFGSA